MLETKAWSDAEPILRECLTIREQQDAEAWTTFNTRSMLGAALLGQQKCAEAEPRLVQGYERMKQREEQISAEGKIRLVEAFERLVQLYEAQQTPDQAAQWRVELEAAQAKTPQPGK